MANETYIIKTSTLREIASAIRTVYRLTDEIPTTELAYVLRTGEMPPPAENPSITLSDGSVLTDSNGVVLTTAIFAPKSTAKTELLIYRQTLVDIADVIREYTGDTAEILVGDLSATILSAYEDLYKLAAPTIYLEVEEKLKLDTPSISLEAEEMSKLDPPSISLEEVLSKLDTPSVSLEVVERTKLDTPSIYLEAGEEIPKLETPSIYLEVVEEIPKLEAPSIYLEITDDDYGTTILIIPDGEATYEENSGGGQTLTIN